MSDMQWMLVLHVVLIVLNALIAIVQYILSQHIKQIRQSLDM